MRIGSEKWINLIQEGASQLGVNVSHEQALLFSQHGRWLIEWNRRINLTAITDPVQVAVKHFLDAIAPLSHIPDHGPLLDIGTGGGFPGVPLKIMRPEQPMTLIDSVRKKISFVKHVIRQLSLIQIEALHIRAQEHCFSRYTYPVVICRALSNWQGAVRLAAPLLTPQGKIVLYQGPKGGIAKNFFYEQVCKVDGVNYHCTTLAYTLPVFGDDRRVMILQPEN